jgi:hypothetical protein
VNLICSKLCCNINEDRREETFFECFHSVGRKRFEISWGRAMTLLIFVSEVVIGIEIPSARVKLENSLTNWRMLRADQRGVFRGR